MGDEGIGMVTDAGPMIHLAEIDCLNSFGVFSQLHVPDVVWQEILRHIDEGGLKCSDTLVQHHVLVQEFDLVVPVPETWARRRDRDPVPLFAEHLCQQIEKPCVQALRKTRGTKPQKAMRTLE